MFDFLWNFYLKILSTQEEFPRYHKSTQVFIYSACNFCQILDFSNPPPQPVTNFMKIRRAETDERAGADTT